MADPVPGTTRCLCLPEDFRRCQDEDCPNAWPNMDDDVAEVLPDAE